MKYFIILSLGVVLGTATLFYPVNATPQSTPNSLGSEWQAGGSGCTCGQRNLPRKGRSLGGVYSALNEFPWRCVIRNKGESKHSLCGCTLISDQWVMTTSQCAKETSVITLGAHDLKNTTGLISLKATRVTRAPWNNHRGGFMALMKLDSPIRITKNIQPICLPFRFTEYDLSGLEGVTSGWGGTTQGSEIQIPRKFNVSITGQETCKRTSLLAPINDDMMCAQSPNNAICFGNIGASLDIAYGFKERHNYYAFGVAAFHARCQIGIPTVYLRVREYLDWIELATGANFCKI